ncbi:M15 family metallopeptidase [Microbacterium sp. STN6]|uniref:M15 family metallopeptidase n=1 Tax=Microbacterium sp. STN6 TaxID=2995588 RepID=UPI00226094F4|nr:M15 family metallopeptidase [Microbacterium sp. STN6]MCX7522491.1 M15 family metallopeptidase [Microbacterium sp. STN6]
MNRRLAVVAPLAATLLLSGCAATPPSPAAHSSAAVQSTAPAAPDSATPTPTTPAFRRDAHSTSDPTSIWVIANKKHPLQPADYAPTDLVRPDMRNVNGQPVRQVIAPALAQMLAAAAQSGLQFQLQSGYRSYATQVSVYNAIVASSGRAAADTSSARPGFSEHQTGLAVDLSAYPASCTLQACFAGTPQGTWLAANAYRYGFVLRYPEGKEQITGYTYEPWHYRYVGTQLAAEMHATGTQTLEEFFGVTGGDYANAG